MSGINDPYADKLIERIIYSTDRKDLLVAARVLDRILWNDFDMLPNWYINKHRVAYFNKFTKPEILPKYYEAINYVLQTWSIK